MYEGSGTFMYCGRKKVEPTELAAEATEGVAECDVLVEWVAICLAKCGVNGVLFYGWGRGEDEKENRAVIDKFRRSVAKPWRAAARKFFFSLCSRASAVRSLHSCQKKPYINSITTTPSARL